METTLDSRLFSEEEEGADAETAEDVRGVEVQETKRRKEAEETLAPSQQDQEIRRPERAANE